MHDAIRSVAKPTVHCHLAAHDGLEILGCICRVHDSCHISTQVSHKRADSQNCNNSFVRHSYSVITMSLNPNASEWYPTPASSPEKTSFFQQIAALDNLSLDDFYEVSCRICCTRPDTSEPLFVTQAPFVVPELRWECKRRSRAVLPKSAAACRRASAVCKVCTSVADLPTLKLHGSSCLFMRTVAPSEPL